MIITGYNNNNNNNQNYQLYYTIKMQGLDQWWKNLGVQQIITPRRSVLPDNFDPLADNFDPLADNFDPLADNFDPLADNFDPLADNFDPLADNFDPLVDNFDHLADKKVRETFLRGLMICCTLRFFHRWIRIKIKWVRNTALNAEPEIRQLVPVDWRLESISAAQLPFAKLSVLEQLLMSVLEQQLLLELKLLLL